MGVAFLLSAAVLVMLPPDRKEEAQTKDSTLGKEMKLGFQYVWNNFTLRTLGGCFVAAGLALGLIQPLAILLVTERLGLAKEHLQWLMAANGVAMILGGGVAMVMSRKLSAGMLLAVGMVVSAAGILLSGLSTILWLTLIAQFISGLAFPAIHIGINTIILKNAEEAFVGRVNGILTPLFMGAMVLTMGLSGWLLGHLSLVSMYVISTIVLFCGALFMAPILKEKEAPHAV
jgi:MFS family permease